MTNAFLSLDPTQLRHLVAVQPELLEAGLVVYVDESGNEVGAQFETEAGEIDLLARDEAGGLVVVMVPDRDAGRDTISDMLQRIGWVRKHLAGAGKPVRGIVLLESLDEEIGYAASAVSDTIDFKTWRLSLAFDLIEL